MTHFTAPAQPLTDGVVTLRLPSPAGDIDVVRAYIEQEQLDGGWLPEIPLVSTEQVIGGWLDAWSGRPSRNGQCWWSPSLASRGSSASSG
jgi:hypothetical protein